jgi:hypothetical protein
MVCEFYSCHGEALFLENDTMGFHIKRKEVRPENHTKEKSK